MKIMKQKNWWWIVGGVVILAIILWIVLGNGSAPALDNISAPPSLPN
jgi:hypothetical protein